MSVIKVIKKKSLPTGQAPEPGSLAEILTPVVPFATIPLALMKGGMDAMGRAFGAAADVDGTPWNPAMDVDQNDSELVVTAEVPGLKKEEVKVEFNGDALVIAGKHKLEHTDGKEGLHTWERHSGQFRRSIPLPVGAMANRAKAELTDGVLKVAIPLGNAKKAVHHASHHKKTSRKRTTA